MPGPKPSELCKRGHNLAETEYFSESGRCCGLCLSWNNKLNRRKRSFAKLFAEYQKARDFFFEQTNPSALASLDESLAKMRSKLMDYGNDIHILLTLLKGGDFADANDPRDLLPS